MIQIRLKDLTKMYPPPNAARVDRAIKNLEHMESFYSSKISIAPSGQVAMFNGFCNALLYSIEVMKAHRALTQKLTLVKDDDYSDDPPLTETIIKGP